MVEDYIDRGMVVAINEVGHILRARTIAESAQSRQVADYLCTIGVDYAQGFYLGRPRVFDAKLTQKP